MLSKYYLPTLIILVWILGFEAKATPTVEYKRILSLHTSANISEFIPTAGVNSEATFRDFNYPSINNQGDLSFGAKIHIPSINSNDAIFLSSLYRLLNEGTPELMALDKQPAHVPFYPNSGLYDLGYFGPENTIANNGQITFKAKYGYDNDALWNAYTQENIKLLVEEKQSLPGISRAVDRFSLRQSENGFTLLQAWYGSYSGLWSIDPSGIARLVIDGEAAQLSFFISSIDSNGNVYFSAKTSNSTYNKGSKLYSWKWNFENQSGDLRILAQPRYSYPDDIPMGIGNDYEFIDLGLLTSNNKGEIIFSATLNHLVTTGEYKSALVRYDELNGLKIVAMIGDEVAGLEPNSKLSSINRNLVQFSDHGTLYFVGYVEGKWTLVAADNDRNLRSVLASGYPVPSKLGDLQIDRIYQFVVNSAGQLLISAMYFEDSIQKYVIYFSDGYQLVPILYRGIEFEVDGNPFVSNFPTYSIKKGFNDSGQFVFSDNWTTGGIFLVTPSLLNIRPISEAGDAQSVNIRDTVAVDGTGSSDPDKNYPLEYSWSILSKPINSMATLNDPALATPSFTADLAGDYTLNLIVTDALGLSSEVDTVTISTINTAPVADAGPDQAILLPGSVVYLDGSQSYDGESDPLTYSWTFSVPSGSVAVLSDATSDSPSFITDIKGKYIASLIVSDWQFNSISDSVEIGFSNIIPLADAGNGQSAVVGDNVYLDGSGSTDANQDSLSYHWSLASVPIGSTTEVVDPSSLTPSFSVDVAGDYVVSLVVNDGLADSLPSNITVTAITLQNEATNSAVSTIQAINSITEPEVVLKNTKMQKALTNQLNSALLLIDRHEYQQALDQLESTLKKMDGCASSNDPRNFDRNDWIEYCTTQDKIYPWVIKTIEYVRILKEKY